MYEIFSMEYYKKIQLQVNAFALRMTFTQIKKKSTYDNEKPSIVFTDL